MKKYVSPETCKPLSSRNISKPWNSHNPKPVMEQLIKE